MHLLVTVRTEDHTLLDFLDDTAPSRAEPSTRSYIELLRRRIRVMKLQTNWVGFSAQGTPVRCFDCVDPALPKKPPSLSVSANHSDMMIMMITVIPPRPLPITLPTVGLLAVLGTLSLVEIVQRFALATAATFLGLHGMPH